MHAFALNKKSGYERESAAVGFQSLPAVLGASSAPFFIPSLPILFDLYSDKGEVVRAGAAAATKAILQLFPPEATGTVFRSLEDILEKGKWQTKVGALDALKSFVANAKESVADELGHILPKVELAMHDTKKEVLVRVVLEYLFVLTTLGCQFGCQVRYVALQHACEPGSGTSCARVGQMHV